MISIERCTSGRLRGTYPVGRHDVEIRAEDEPVDTLAARLREEADRLLEGDRPCRKVVFAAPEGDLPTIAAAEQAGFRFVVAVDVLDGNEMLPLALMVREPDRVTHVDGELEDVPQT